MAGSDGYDWTPPTIGQRLVAWRKAQGLSQRELARQIGLDPGTLSRIEQGRAGSPNRRVRQAIEALLRISDVRLDALSDQNRGTDR